MGRYFSCLPPRQDGGTSDQNGHPVLFCFACLGPAQQALFGSPVYVRTDLMSDGVGAPPLVGRRIVLVGVFRHGRRDLLPIVVGHLLLYPNLKERWLSIIYGDPSVKSSH